MSGHVDNARRADWASAALDAFMKRTGQTDRWEALGDLMANLMHLVDRELVGLGNFTDPEHPNYGYSVPADEVDPDGPGVEVLQHFVDRGAGHYLAEVEAEA